MVEVYNPLQLTLAGIGTKIEGCKRFVVDTSKPKLTGQEQIKLLDERIRQEIPNLRILEKGRAVFVPSQKDRFTRVILEQDAILQKFPQKKHPKRFSYCLRSPVLVTSATYHDNWWTVGQGIQVFAFSEKKKVPQKLIPEITFRLRRYTKAA